MSDCLYLIIYYKHVQPKKNLSAKYSRSALQAKPAKKIINIIIHGVLLGTDISKHNTFTRLNYIDRKEIIKLGYNYKIPPHS